MPLPTISIVTPSYNQAEFLETTIRSVLAQRYPQLEYIVIDGGSTDGSVDIIRKYEEHLAFWCSEPDGGQYHAIVKGFERSTGEIMAWINSDDFFLAHTFNLIATIMSDHPAVHWVTTSLRLGADREGNILYTAPVAGYSRESFLDGENTTFRWPNHGWIQQEATFWRRSLWQPSAQEILTRFEYAGDFALWAEFFKSAHLYSVNSPLGVFRLHDAQKTNALDRYHREARAVLAEQRQASGWRPSPIRSALRLLHLARIPFAGRVATSLFGYRGYRLARHRARSAEAAWTVETHRFL